MDYFFEAFGGFNPQSDPDAAVKFVLNNILMDERLPELSVLLTDGHDIGGLEGEPGWSIERRDTGPSGDMPGYADWPVGTNFRVNVDENAFRLAYPEQFLKTDEFHRYVRKAMDVYSKRKSSAHPALSQVLSRLEV